MLLPSIPLLHFSLHFHLLHLHIIVTHLPLLCNCHATIVFATSVFCWQSHWLYYIWDTPRLITGDHVSLIVGTFWTSCLVLSRVFELLILILLHWRQNPGQGMASGGIIALLEPFHKDDAKSWFRCFQVCAAVNEWEDSRKLLRLPALLKGCGMGC